MDLETAKEIVRLTDNHQLIQAIQLMRAHTGYGLLDAKRYLESQGSFLLTRLCTDFIQNKRDLLAVALREHRVLTARILELMDEISNEVELGEANVS